MKKERVKESFEIPNDPKLDYFAIHFIQVIVGVLLLSVGVITVLHFDYGNISFLFAVPQFFLTGLVPTIFSLLILLRVFLEAERITVSSDDKAIYLKGRRIKKQTLKLDLDSIQYYGIKYRETRYKRWMIIAILVLFTIEVHWQNAMDLWGYARIAPILLICTILMTSAIILFVVFPRKFLEIGTNESRILVPLRHLSTLKTQKLLKILKIKPDILKRDKPLKIIYKNIIDGFFTFVMGLFLLIFGIVLCLTPAIFFGSFSRTIAVLLGMKLLLRVSNGDPYYFKSGEDSLYVGRSIHLTFIKTLVGEAKQQKCFSPFRYHPLEIACFVYLIFQAIRYSFRNIWYVYMGFSIIYFAIGMTIIGLIFIRWFNPISIIEVNFKEYSIKIKDAKPFDQKGEGRLSMKDIFNKKLKDFIANFNNIQENKAMIVSLIIFVIFLVFPIIYILIGGNFIIL